MADGGEVGPDGLRGLADALADMPEGQLIALGTILIAMGFWRRTSSFWRRAYTANVALMCAGFVLIGYQLTGYFIS